MVVKFTLFLVPMWVSIVESSFPVSHFSDSYFKMLWKLVLRMRKDVLFHGANATHKYMQANITTRFERECTVE